MNVSCSDTGCPPVTIHANGISGGTAEISGQISSQFLSSLLMMAPLAANDVTIKIKDELTSVPYVLMTTNLMKKFGVSVENTDNKIFKISPSSYVSPKSIFIEGDASSASYFLAGAAITGGPVTVYGCGSESVQGDSRYLTALFSFHSFLDFLSFFFLFFSSLLLFHIKIFLSPSVFFVHLNRLYPLDLQAYWGKWVRL